MLNFSSRVILLFCVACLVILVVFVGGIPVGAQTSELPPGPIYVVKAGDTLWGIALRFDVGLEELIAYNRLSSQDIYVGDRLVIPGFPDVSGIIEERTIGLGETFRLLSRASSVDTNILIKLNRLVSPGELYAGYNLITLRSESSDEARPLVRLQVGETILELAVRQNVSPWKVMTANRLKSAARALPGDILVVPGGVSPEPVSGFPDTISSISLDPLPLTQGDTAQIRVRLNTPASLQGWLGAYPLRFFEQEQASWVALQGVHAMTEPGLYPFRLLVSSSDGRQQVFEQMVSVQAGYFRRDPVLHVEPSTIDPAVTEPENEWLFSLTASATPQKYWQGLFRLPVDAQYCIRSMYGNRRSYNGSDFIYFHTGVDYGVCSESRPFDVYAPAAGVVIFAGFKTVRGNATIIDHGWGVYSGFWHQEEIYVSEGDFVEPGQLIGKIGKTGRATGPHLHWELWVNGVQVNPLQWLEKVFPHD
ncbi:MAG: LysM peptidoglycan-binding domain-containing M23 family metallopeptidase [Anaerolineales bacterium]|nr:LysM peptidoglycan-binding domain-containing M23 family metallopeptidase [Anaerolineales bacterium]